MRTWVGFTIYVCAISMLRCDQMAEYRPCSLLTGHSFVAVLFRSSSPHLLLDQSIHFLFSDDYLDVAVMVLFI
jgi:hypothetical protein